MQVSVETTSGLERRLTVGVPAEKVDSAVEGKLQEAQKNVRLDGFRPGKVPMREVKRRFGSAVRNEVLADVMPHSVGAEYRRRAEQCRSGISRHLVARGRGVNK